MICYRLLLTLTFIFVYSGLNTISAQIQEVRIGSFTKHQPNGYEVEGKAYLESHVDSLVLRLSSNFKNPQPGPDLDVYLASQDDVRDGSSVRIAGLKSSIGEQSYRLPDSISLDTYDYATIYCTEYDHEWAQAKLGSSQDTTNSVYTEPQPTSPSTNAIRAWRQNKTEAFRVYGVNGRLIVSNDRIKSLSQLDARKLYIIRYQLTGHDTWRTEKVILNR